MRRVHPLAAVLSLLLSFSAHAQGVSAEKRALIKELLAVTNATKNAEEIMDSMFAQMREDLLRVLTQTMENEGSLTDAQRAEMRQQIFASAQRSADKFRERFKQRVNFPELVEEVSLEVYDKYFSEAELRDLIAFYKTPTGRKSIELTSQLFTESMTRTSERLTPLVQSIVREITDEELKRIERPAPKPPARRRRR